MNITLTPELERLIEEKVESGRYASRDAVVRAALELFCEREAAEDRLEALLEQGGRSGDGIDLTAEARLRIERRATAALRVKRPA